MTTFTLVVSRWKDALVIGGEYAIAQLIAWLLLYEGIDQILYGQLGEVLDRVTGFDAMIRTTPTAEDELFFESLEAHLPTSAVVLIGCSVLLFLVTFVLCNFAWVRLFVAARHEVEISANQALMGALRRSGRLLLVAVPFVMFLALLTTVFVLIIVNSPLLLLLFVPLVGVLFVGLLPYLAATYTIVAVGPKGTPVLGHAVDVLRGKWVFTFTCLLVATVPALAVSYGTNFVSQGAILINVAAYIVLSVIFGSAIAAVQSASMAALHYAIGADTDPSLT